MKSEPHYLLKLLHLQNHEFRHPPCWSQSLLLPLLGRRFPPAPSSDRGAPSTLCAISLFVGRSSVNFARTQVGCCASSSHHFLAGSKLTCPIFSCTCLAKLRWDEPDYTHHLSLHLAAGHCWRKGPQPRTLVSLRTLDHQPRGLLLLAISPCFCDLLTLQPPKKLFKHFLSFPSTSNMPHLSFIDFGFHFCFIKHRNIRQDLLDFGPPNLYRHLHLS